RWTREIADGFEKRGIGEHLLGSVGELRQVDRGLEQLFHRAAVFVERLEICLKRLLHPLGAEGFDCGLSRRFEVGFGPARRRDGHYVVRNARSGMGKRSISFGSNFVRPPAYVRPWPSVTVSQRCFASRSRARALIGCRG